MSLLNHDLSEGGLTRRQLLQLGTMAAAGAVVFTGCSVEPSNLLAQSRVRLAEDIVSGFEDWYATTCRGCDAGCGLIARVIEGRARKLEGNPDHPVNRGKLCVRGQAGVQEQYHPDRIKNPFGRRGLRAPHGPLIQESWAQGLGELSSRLRTIQERGQAGSVAIITPPLRAHRALVVERFASAYGAQWLTLDPINEAPLREAVRRVFGQEQLPDFDIANASYVLSFGADFLSTWLSPVHYGTEYGVFRQGSYRAGQEFRPRTDRPRGYLVHVDSHFSATAANADEWIPVRPGGEGALALSIAQVIVSEGLGDAAGAGAFGAAGGLEAYTPERAAAMTGVSAERIREIARAFAQRGPSLAIAGGTAGAQTNGTATLSAILGLNQLVGAVGREGGVRFNPPAPIDGLPPSRPATSLGEWQQFIARLQGGQVEAVLIHGANPAYSLPPQLGFADALPRSRFVASFSSFMDETTGLADLILPSNLPLEEWGSDVPDPGPGFPVLTIQQPVVTPFFDTRSFSDVLLAVGEELGAGVRQALPWRTMRALLREEARRLQELNRGSVQEADFERFWNRLLQQGGWWDTAAAAPAPAAPAAGGAQLGTVPGARLDGDEGQYPFHLVLFEHISLGKGEGAHLPWLQATPDPVTSAVWRTWVEVNPGVARDMGLVEGDVVAVETAQGRLELPVYVSPAAPPNVLAVPLGQGHSAYGRWARDRGTNPIALLAPLTDADTDQLAYGATRARLVATGRRTRLPKLEGDVVARQVPGEPVLLITRGENDH